MLIDEYLLSNPIFDRVPLIFNALKRISSDSVFFFNVPLFELFKVASVDGLRDLKREAFWRRHRTTYIKLDKKSANIQSLIHPVVLLICSCHILEKQHKKIKKSRKSGILYVRLCSGCKGLQVSNMPRPKLDSRRDSEISCKNIRQFRMQYAPG